MTNCFINYYNLQLSFAPAQFASFSYIYTGTGSMKQAVLRGETTSGKNSLPRISITLSSLIADYKKAKKCFGKNLLEESMTLLMSIFTQIPLLVVSKSEEGKVFQSEESEHRVMEAL